MPHLYCTRLDVRVRDADELREGRFTILESNGTIGVSGRGFAYNFTIHWPRRMITGLYNIARSPCARLDPRVLVRRIRMFLLVGGWDFRFTDGF